MTEAELQAKIEEIVDGEGLLAFISDADQLDPILQGMAQPDYLPAFPLDYLIRYRSAQAAQHVLDILDSCKKISTKSGNIALDSKEGLYPDLLLHSDETGKIVIVELKRSDSASRQAVTELTAYEHEVRNHLPFASTYDICQVVISTEFPTLLSHSLATMITWGGRQVLCLLAVVSGDQVRLRVHLPNCWTPLGQGRLPANALVSQTLCLYPGDAPVDDEVALKLALTAANLISHEGHRSGSHGFLFIWEDLWEGLLSDCRWHITIVTVNPYAFLPDAVESGLLNAEHSAIAEQLFASSGDVELGYGADHVQDVSREALALLSRDFQPQWEDLRPWWWEREFATPAIDTKHTLRHRAAPLHVACWGQILDYASMFLRNPHVRERLFPSVGRSGTDWTHPLVGIPLIDWITGDHLFYGEHFNCMDVLRFGAILGQYRSLCKTAEGKGVDELANLPACLFWCESQLIVALQAILGRYQRTPDIVVPPPVIALRAPEKASESVPAIESFRSWFAAQFLGKHHPVHCQLLDLGYNGHPLLDNYFTECLSAEQKEQIEAYVAGICGPIIAELVAHSLAEDFDAGTSTSILTGVRELYLNGAAVSSADFLNALEAVPTARYAETFHTGFPELLGTVIPPVFHRLLPPSAFVDWPWVREQIAILRQQPDCVPAIFFTSDGDIATGTLGAGITNLQHDPAGEVLVVRDIAGIQIIRAEKWDDLENGTVGADWMMPPLPDA